MTAKQNELRGRRRQEGGGGGVVVVVVGKYTLK